MDPFRAPRSAAQALALFVALSLLAAAANPGFAQEFSLRGEVTFSSDLALDSAGERLSGSSGVSFQLHLEAELDYRDLGLMLVLDPLARLPDPTALEPTATLVEPGLTEAYLIWRSGRLDLSAGVERLPLETARLSVPFGVEARSASGLPSGVLGARLVYFPADWRLRAAALYRIDDAQAGGVLSARRDFGGADLEAHALYLDGWAFGLGGSGLIGDVVVYGEGWLLLAPLAMRGALGASGFLGDALWTLEAAQAPAPAGVGALPSDPLPQLAGQLTLPLGDDGSLDLRLGAGLAQAVSTPVASALQALGSLAYTHALTDGQLGVSASVAHGELGTRYGLRLELTGFF